MARPTRLRLLDERPIPDRPEDVVAVATEVAQFPPQPDRLSDSTAEAIIAELKARAATAENAAAEARANQQKAEQTTEAVRKVALDKIAEVEQQRDAATLAATGKADERKQSMAVATALSLSILRQIAGELVKIFSWLPALGALLGGFWLFDRSLAAPSPQTLVALALYGLVVVAPAAVLTLRGRTNA